MRAVTNSINMRNAPCARLPNGVQYSHDKPGPHLQIWNVFACLPRNQHAWMQIAAKLQRLRHCLEATVRVCNLNKYGWKPIRAFMDGQHEGWNERAFYKCVLHVFASIRKCSGIISEHKRQDRRWSLTEASKHSRKNSQAADPLAVRVAGEYRQRCAVCPAQGIGLPHFKGAARATRSSGGAVSYGRARYENLRVRRLPLNGKANRGASGHQRGLAGVGPLRRHRP